MTKKDIFKQIIERKLLECPEWLRPQLRTNLLRDFDEKYHFEL